MDKDITDFVNSVLASEAGIDWGGGILSFDKARLFPPHQCEELSVSRKGHEFNRQAHWLFGVKVYDRHKFNA